MFSAFFIYRYTTQCTHDTSTQKVCHFFGHDVRFEKNHTTMPLTLHVTELGCFEAPLVFFSSVKAIFLVFFSSVLIKCVSIAYATSCVPNVCKHTHETRLEQMCIFFRVQSCIFPKKYRFFTKKLGLIFLLRTQTLQVKNHLN